MNRCKYEWLHSGILILGLMAVLLAGVDLDYHRIGWGLLILGISGIFLLFPSEDHKVTRFPFWIMVLLGAGYFILRGLLGGPIGLAVAESLLVVVFLAVYLGVAFGGGSTAKVLLFALVVMSWLQIGVSGVQYFGDEVFYIFSEKQVALNGVSGFFGHYNPFAAFCNASIFLLLAVALFAQEKLWVRVGLIVTVLFLAVAVWLSGSRGGWLALTGGGGAFMLISWWSLYVRKHPKASMAGLLAVVGSVVGLSSSWMILDHKTAVRSGIKERVVIDGDVRSSFQGIAFDLFLDAPVTGLGARAFSYKVIDEWDTDRLYSYTKDPQFVHNEFLECLSSYGLVGLLIIFIGLGIHSGRAVVDVMQRSEGRSEALERALKLGSCAAVAALLIQCYFSFLMHIPALVGFLALLVGIQARGNEAWAGGFFAGMKKLVLLVVSGSVIFIGYHAASSDLWTRKSAQLVRSGGEEVTKMSAINALWMAGEKGKDPGQYEKAGQMAMGYAFDLSAAGERASAARFSDVALTSFQEALRLNPFSQVANSGAPRVLDSRQRYEEAEVLHEKAIAQFSAREPFLQVNFHASKSSFYRAYDFLKAGKITEARESFRLAGARMKRHRKLAPRPLPEGARKEFIDQVLLWSDLLDGESLYRAGHAVWMKRDPERGLALMLAAKVRYERARPLMGGYQSVWNVQSKALFEHIAQIQAGQVVPAKISKEEVEQIAAGLVSAASNR